MSKLLKYPTFKSLPPSTDAANVEENIKFWIEKGKQDKINNYLIPDKSRPNGYRFINSYDLTDKIVVEQVIHKVNITVTYKRLYYCPDSFCPLYFSELRTDITICINDEQAFEYRSDADLKRKIKLFKESEK